MAHKDDIYWSCTLNIRQKGWWCKGGNKKEFSARKPMVLSCSSRGSKAKKGHGRKRISGVTGREDDIITNNMQSVSFHPVNIVKSEK
jgi:hypothetical protein